MTTNARGPSRSLTAVHVLMILVLSTYLQLVSAEVRGAAYATWLRAAIALPGIDASYASGGSCTQCNGMHVTQDYSCNSINKVPKEQRCAFVTANCTTGGSGALAPTACGMVQQMSA